MGESRPPPIPPYLGTLIRLDGSNPCLRTLVLCVVTGSSEFESQQGRNPVRTVSPFKRVLKLGALIGV